MCYCYTVLVLQLVLLVLVLYNAINMDVSAKIIIKNFCNFIIVSMVNKIETEV